MKIYKVLQCIISYRTITIDLTIQYKKESNKDLLYRIERKKLYIYTHLTIKIYQYFFFFYFRKNHIYAYDYITHAIEYINHLKLRRVTAYSIGTLLYDVYI